MSARWTIAAKLTQNQSTNGGASWKLVKYNKDFLFACSLWTRIDAFPHVMAQMMWNRALQKTEKWSGIVNRQIRGADSDAELISTPITIIIQHMHTPNKYVGPPYWDQNVRWPPCMIHKHNKNSFVFSDSIHTKAVYISDIYTTAPVK